ncbi:hypothetical protein DCC81_12100 [Chitinophaga parva]|uniref:Uncharacterized protein n=1 Tax=Chitinophaga parva TaxID=2169414 RepID=A0A2T7BFI6_9BACT|nr:hypothetical protein [Chitinophaga parva]PUZ25049.1 hypothetical protein DCC81_12100 [Chitinophaga parva]
MSEQVTIYNKAIETFRGGGEILLANQGIVSKALTAGNAILGKINANGGKLDAGLDQLVNDYLVKIGQRKKEIEEARKPITQMMDEMKKYFTAEEAKLDVKGAGTIPAQLQQHRNEYAKEQAELEKQRQEEAARRASKERERVQLVADVETQLNKHFNDHLLSYKQRMHTGFNEITLENFADKERKLADIPCLYSLDHYQSFKPTLRPIQHNHDELAGIITGVDLFANFSAIFSSEVEELKQQFIDRLPSKKSELEALAAAEKARQEEAARAAEAERLRQQEIAKAEGERKRQLEEEARAAAVAEKARQEELAAEQRRLEEDRLRREQEEATRMAQEAKEKEEKAAQQIEMNKAAGETMALFDAEASLAEGAEAPETRQGFEIKVLHAAGYVQIFQFWFENEGKGLGIDKIGNTKMDQMKAYCEKQAHKNSTVIESKFLQYVPTYKAVNRKAVK